MSDAPNWWPNAPIMHPDGNWANETPLGPLDDGSRDGPGCLFAGASAAEFDLHGRTPIAATTSSQITTTQPSYTDSNIPSYEPSDHTLCLSNAMVRAPVNHIQESFVPEDTAGYNGVAPYEVRDYFTNTDDDFDGAIAQTSVGPTSLADPTADPTRNPNTEFPGSMTYTNSQDVPSSDGSQKAFVCSQEGCSASFKRFCDLSRHQKKHLPPTWHCLEHGCRYRYPRGFYRRDKLADHQKTKRGLGSKHARWGFSQPEAPGNGVTEIPLAVDKLCLWDVRILKGALKSIWKYSLELSGDGPFLEWHREIPSALSTG